MVDRWLRGCYHFQVLWGDLNIMAFAIRGGTVIFLEVGFSDNIANLQTNVLLTTIRIFSRDKNKNISSKNMTTTTHTHFDNFKVKIC